MAIKYIKADLDIDGVATAPRFISTQTTGIAPLSIASTTVVTNLNADLLDGNHASAFATSGHTHSYDNYVSWNLKTGGVQRIAVVSGGTLDIVGGTGITATYSAGGVVTLASTITQYSLPLAADGTRGGIQIGYAENGKNYPVQLSSEKAFVNVPWTDTIYSLSAATSTVLGGMKLFSNTVQSVAATGVSAIASRTYGIQVNASGQAVVNVPWVDTNTVYTHPTQTAINPTLTGALVLNTLSVNTLGHVTAATTRTLTLANLGYTGSATANDYTHPAYTARSIDTTGAEVLDVFTSDAIGAVTNITKRTMTLGDLGYTGATNANYITNNNQLTNGAGYITTAGSCASATIASTVTVTSSDSASTYRVVWHSGNNLYSTAGVYLNASTDALYASDFIGTSDIRQKENIVKLEPKELLTTYKEFNIKGTTEKRTGLIAQELEINHPEFVRTNEDGIKSISYIDVHSAEIAYLKAKNQDLEERIERLEGLLETMLKNK